MRRLLHSLGRWRATHCDRCGRRIAENQTGWAAAADGHRLVHFDIDDCHRKETGR